VHGGFDDHEQARYAAVQASDFRAEFPVLERVAYLNSGTDGPVPRRGVDAAAAQMRLELEDGRANRAHFDRIIAGASALRERLAAAKGRRGWVGGQLLIPLDEPHRRAVVGTWESRADWQAWHEDERFLESRERMDGLQEDRSEIVWYEVVTEGRGTGTASVGPPQ